jgi:hypothetical protein
VALSRPNVITLGSVAGGSAASQGVTADAGSNVQTTSAANRSLSASGTAGGTAPYSYSWVLTTRPSGSSASLTSATSQACTLTGMDEDGAYTATVTVTDSHSDGPFTDTDAVTVDLNIAGAPTASAGSDVQTAATTNRTLSGSGSGGVGSLSYAWVLTTKPAGSSASITSASSASATLTGIDTSGAYHCTLTVTDSAGTPQTGADSVVIDYAGPSTPAWTDVIDIDLTAATATTLTTGTTTVVDGNTWFVRTRSTDGSMSAEITGNGLEFDFGGNNAGWSRVLLQIPGADLNKDSDGYFPRIRVQVAWTGMVLGTTNSFIGLAIAQDVNTGSGLDNPVAISEYVQTSAANYKWRGESWKGTWGGGASGTTTVTGSTNHGDTTGVLEIADVGQGLFRHGGHGGDQTLSSGLDTFVAYSTPAGHNSSTTESTFYEVGSGTGPWVGMICRNKSTGGSETITVTRIRVQEFV